MKDYFFNQKKYHNSGTSKLKINKKYKTLYYKVFFEFDAYKSSKNWDSQTMIKNSGQYDCNCCEKKGD